MSKEIFWGPTNSQPVQLARGKAWNKWVWPGAQVIKPGCCWFSRTYLYALLWFYFVDGFFIWLSRWFWDLGGYCSSCSSRNRDTEWCINGRQLWVSVEGSQCAHTLCTLFLFLTLEDCISIPSVGTFELRKIPFSFFQNRKSHSDMCHVNFLFVSEALDFLAAPTFFSLPLFPSNHCLVLCLWAAIVKEKREEVSGCSVFPPPPWFFLLLENNLFSYYKSIVCFL